MKIEIEPLKRTSTGKPALQLENESNSIYNNSILSITPKGNTSDENISNGTLIRGATTKSEKYQSAIPSPADIEKVKNAYHAPFGLFPFTLLYTGLRKGEAIALQYKDIDLDNHVIHITKSSYYKSNKAIIKPPKTDGGYRDVILLDLLANKLQQGESNDYIFSFDGGKTPLTAKQFIVGWQKYLSSTGLNITAHQLRHAFATILYENDVSDKDAQDLLGHSSIVVTRDIYTHISKIRKAKIWIKLNKAIQ